MASRLFCSKEMTFTLHPKFPDVRMAIMITGKDTDANSVCLLDIAPGKSIPIHTHDPQVDSILVISGKGEAYVNGGWELIEAGDYIFVPKGEDHGIRNTGHDYLKIFVHHSPPIL
ncbi:MAG: cupin domain-containing protein [Deltaproteobacteria bacterium]|nr:cupin domain-containing protein [Deltaproteobacteria bacterium]